MEKRLRRVSKAVLAAGRTPPPAATLADRAHAQLKEWIISAHYLPGQFLQEARICSDLGFGRTPIRQALQRLDQEGLVEIIHRKGIVVRSDSLIDILLALETRFLVEPFCAAKCAEQAKPTDLEALETLRREYVRACHGEDRRALMNADRELHGMIGMVAGNRHLLDLLRPIQERMSRIWFLPQWQPTDFGETANEHDALIEAILKHEPEAASLAMRAHLQSLKSRVIAGAMAPIRLTVG